MIRHYQGFWAQKFVYILFFFTFIWLRKNSDEGEGADWVALLQATVLTSSKLHTIYAKKKYQKQIFWSILRKKGMKQQSSMKSAELKILYNSTWQQPDINLKTAPKLCISTQTRKVSILQATFWEVRPQNTQKRRYFSRTGVLALLLFPEYVLHYM